jgi:hypothetical protein
MCHDGKEFSLKLTKTPTVGVAKLNLVSIDQVTNEHIVVEVQLEKLKQTHGEARKDGPPPNHTRGMLVRSKDVLINRLFTKISAKAWKTILLNKILSS